MITVVNADRGLGPLAVVIFKENRYEVSGSRVLDGTISRPDLAISPSSTNNCEVSALNVLQAPSYRFKLLLQLSQDHV